MTSRKTQATRRARAARRAKRIAARHFRKERGRRHLRWDFDGMIYLVVACAALIFAFSMARDAYLLQHRGEAVPATVLKLNDGKRPSIDVRYTTRSGETVEDSTSNFDDATAGGTVEVVYDPENPSRMQATDYGFDFLSPGIFGAGGLILLAIATGQFWTRGKHA